MNGRKRLAIYALATIVIAAINGIGMYQTYQPDHKLEVALVWALFIGAITACALFGLVRNTRQQTYRFRLTETTKLDRRTSHH